MSGRETSKWIFAGGDEFAYLYCDNCKRKISAKDVVFADHPYNKCPKCGRYMSDVDDDIISKLEDSII